MGNRLFWSGRGNCLCQSKLETLKFPSSILLGINEHQSRRQGSSLRLEPANVPRVLSPPGKAEAQILQPMWSRVSALRCAASATCGVVMASAWPEISRSVSNRPVPNHSTEAAGVNSPLARTSRQVGLVGLRDFHGYKGNCSSKQQMFLLKPLLMSGGDGQEATRCSSLQHFWTHSLQTSYSKAGN